VSKDEHGKLPGGPDILGEIKEDLPFRYSRVPVGLDVFHSRPSLSGDHLTFCRR